MGKISQNKRSFAWQGTAASLKSILQAQRWILKADAIARRLNHKNPLTVTEYLTKVF
jgi:hypothetical protein